MKINRLYWFLGVFGFSVLVVDFFECFDSFYNRHVFPRVVQGSVPCLHSSAVSAVMCGAFAIIFFVVH